MKHGEMDDGEVRDNGCEGGWERKMKKKERWEKKGKEKRREGEADRGEAGRGTQLVTTHLLHTPHTNIFSLFREL